MNYNLWTSNSWDFFKSTPNQEFCIFLFPFFFLVAPFLHSFVLHFFIFLYLNLFISWFFPLLIFSFLQFFFFDFFIFSGTGKSYVLRVLQDVLDSLGLSDKIAFTAPTGVAACNVRGLTIHSWAGIGRGKRDLFLNWFISFFIWYSVQL